MKPEPKAYCQRCKTSVERNHWYWMSDTRYAANGKWRCRQAKRDAEKRFRNKRKENVEKLEAYRKYQRDYHQANKHIARYKAYLHADKKANRVSSLNRRAAFLLMSQPCFYCTIAPAEGIDRLDSKLGHTKENCVPCCEKCNIILGDIPLEAKLVLKPGLEKIFHQALLSQWTIPTKRKNIDNKN